MKQDSVGANGNGNTPFEKDLFFYHPDHLGSSNYITDTNGKLYEHLEYFPFGETWVHENSNTQRTPYLFTAKELDEETGLYYYGARYYDPRTSVWQSADPILEKYLPKATNAVELEMPQIGIGLAHFNLPGMGGVYESKNIALYSYAHLNPLVYVDPDGKETNRHRPTYSSLAANFPLPSVVSREQLFKSIGGKVQSNALNPASPWVNTCASRVSCALNKSGNDINAANVPKDAHGNSQWSSGADNKKYVYRVEALTEYLKNEYGQPDVVLKGNDVGDFKKTLAGQKGIIIFDMRGRGAGSTYTGHATLWGGSETIDKTDYSSHSSRILFWKLPDQ